MKRTEGFTSILQLPGVTIRAHACHVTRIQASAYHESFPLYRQQSFCELCLKNPAYYTEYGFKTPMKAVLTMVTVIFLLSRMKLSCGQRTNYYRIILILLN